MEIRRNTSTKFEWDGLNLKDYIRKLVAGKLHMYEDKTVFNIQELATLLTEDELKMRIMSSDVSVRKAKEFIINYWTEAAELFFIIQDIDKINPFDKPEEFYINMLRIGVEDLFYESSYLNQRSTAPIKLTKEVINILENEINNNNFCFIIVEEQISFKKNNLQFDYSSNKQKRLLASFNNFEKAKTEYERIKLNFDYRLTELEKNKMTGYNLIFIEKNANEIIEIMLCAYEYKKLLNINKMEEEINLKHYEEVE